MSLVQQIAIFLGAAVLMVPLFKRLGLGAEIEADIEPFKSLLLGLFFVAVGMSANIGLISAHPIPVMGLVLALMSVKFLVLFALGKFSGAGTDSARNLGVTLAQGGEFAFVLFSVATTYKVMTQSLTELLVVVVTLSMAATPLLFAFNEKVIAQWLKPKIQAEYDRIVEPENRVIIAGFGRFGQIVARVLRTRKIAFTAMEASPAQVDFVRRFGNKIHYGDGSRLDLLRAARADKAEIFVLAIDDIAASVKTAETVRRHFPKLAVYARARNRYHAYKLMDLGVMSRGKRSLDRESWHREYNPTPALLFC